MILAAIIPYTHGYAGVVVLDTVGPRIIAVRSLACSHTEALAEPATDERGRAIDARRVVDAGDVDGLLAPLFALLETHGAERVVLETPWAYASGTAAEHGRAVVGAIMRQATGAGLGDFVTVVDPSWRVKAGGREGIAGKACALTGWPQTPDTGDTEGTRAAAALALAYTGPEAQEAPRRIDEDQRSVDAEHIGRSGVDLGNVAPSEQGNDRGDYAGMRLRSERDTGSDGEGGGGRGRVAGDGVDGGAPAGSARRPAAVDARATHVGIDVGSTYAAAVALDCDPPRPRLIDANTFVLADHGDDAIDDAVKNLCGFVLGFGCEHVVIERPDHFYVPAHPGDTPDRVAKRAAKSGTAMLVSERLGERTRSALLLVGVDVTCAPRGTIASRVYGRGVVGTGVELDAWLGATVDGWEGRTRVGAVTGPEHERDACVAALLPWAEAKAETEAGARREDPLLEKPKRRGTAKGARDESHRKRYQEPAAVAARAAEAERRRAAGCECPGKHRKTCKLHVPKLRGIG